MTAKEWGEYIVGQLHIPDPKQREWLKRQIAQVAEDSFEASRKVAHRYMDMYPTPANKFQEGYKLAATNIASGICLIGVEDEPAK